MVNILFARLVNLSNSHSCIGVSEAGGRQRLARAARKQFLLLSAVKSKSSLTLLLVAGSASPTRRPDNIETRIMQYFETETDPFVGVGKAGGAHCLALAACQPYHSGFMRKPVIYYRKGLMLLPFWWCRQGWWLEAPPRRGAPAH